MGHLGHLRAIYFYELGGPFGPITGHLVLQAGWAIWVIYGPFKFGRWLPVIRISCDLTNQSVAKGA